MIRSVGLDGQSFTVSTWRLRPKRLSFQTTEKEDRHKDFYSTRLDPILVIPSLPRTILRLLIQGYGRFDLRVDWPFGNETGDEGDKP